MKEEKKTLQFKNVIPSWYVYKEAQLFFVCQLISRLVSVHVTLILVFGDCRAGKDTSFNGIKTFFYEKKWIFHSFMKLTLPKLIHYSLKMCFFVPISNKYLIVSQRIDIPSWNDSYIWRNNLNQSFDWPWKHNNY